MLNRRFGNCCIEFCIDDSRSSQEELDYINTLSRVCLTISSLSHMEYVCNGFAYIDHVFDIICSSRLQERRSFELVLHKTIDHVTFLYLDNCSKGLDLFHSLLSIFSLIIQENAPVIRLQQKIL